MVHPEVHSDGEVAWRPKVSELARSSESLVQHTMVRTIRLGQTLRRRRDITLARLVLAPNACFAGRLSRDHGFFEAKLAEVPNIIDLDRFTPLEDPNRSDPIEPLYVSRMAVRTGVVVSLWERVGDLAGRIQTTAIRGASLVSDYRPLPKRPNQAVARYVGALKPDELPGIYRRSAVVLQPTPDERLALAVGEGFAGGLALVASDEVGATEQVSPEVCGTFRAVYTDGFEAALRTLVPELSSPDTRARLLVVAGAEAERSDPHVVAGQLAKRLEAVRSIPTTSGIPS